MRKVQGHNPVVAEALYVKEIFWCHDCDCQKVDGNDPSTGKFFSAFGHVRRFAKPNDKTPVVTEDYAQIVFALCTSCLLVREDSFF